MKPQGPQNLSRVATSKAAHRQSGMVPQRPQAGNLRHHAVQLLQGCAYAAGVVLLFGAAGWLDRTSEQQHQLALARQQVLVARAHEQGVQRGRADSLRTAELAWQAANAEQQYRCGVQHAQ